MTTVLLRNGRVIDPSTHHDGVCDLLVEEGRIAAIGQGLASDGAEVIDCTQRLVLPGLIDTHAHVYQYFTGRFGLNADLCGVRSGVTTLVDQGGPSCMTLPGFRHFIVGPASTRVVAFLSAYLVGGLEGHFYPELYRPDCIDAEAVIRAVAANPDLVKGIKVHAEVGGFARWGLDVLRKSARIAKAVGLPAYVHFGQLWALPEDGSTYDPDSVLPGAMDLLKPGDILAHPFSRHPGGFIGSDGRLHPIAKEALARGLKLDVGHGSHFSFRVARTVIDAGLLPDTLGADMHGYNTKVPSPPGTPALHPDESPATPRAVRFSLVSAMNSMMALGLSFEQVLPMVTTNAAAMIRMEKELGTLQVGRAADISVLSDSRGKWTLRDAEGTELVAERRLDPLFCLRAGIRHEANAEILPTAEADS